VGVFISWLYENNATNWSIFWVNTILGLLITVMGIGIGMFVEKMSSFMKFDLHSNHLSTTVAILFVSDFALGALIKYLFSIIHFSESIFSGKGFKFTTEFFLSPEWFDDVGMSLLSIGLVAPPAQSSIF
jgi:uncharacterized membrane protein YciS (DUF1049 family)